MRASISASGGDMAVPSKPITRSWPQPGSGRPRFGALFFAKAMNESEETNQ
jgi:hypothetical protein